MFMDIETILQDFLSGSESIFRDILGQWLDRHKAISLQYQSTVNDFSSSITPESSPEMNHDFWVCYHEHIDSVLEWTQTVSPLPETPDFDALNAVLDPLRETISDKNQAIVELPVENDFWSPHPEDALRVSIWKWFDRRFRSTRKTTRSFSYQNFYEAHLVQPVLMSLNNWHFKYLRFCNDNLSRIHTSFEEFNSHIQLSPEISGEQYLKQDVPEPALKNYTAIPGSIIEEIAEFGRQAEMAFQQEIREIAGSVRHLWEQAGTFAYPESQFSSKIITRGETSLSERYTEGCAAWEKHFISEQEDWQKDGELALLRVSTVEQGNETLEIIRRRIHEKLLPAFSEVLAILDTSLEKFRQDAPADKTKLKTDILTESRTLSRLLRQERLPALMDLLGQATFDQIVSGYFARLWDSLNLIADEHHIIRSRNLESTLPRTRTESVPFKELVENELLPPLEVQRDDILIEIRTQQDSIHRTISEIDQVVEFNLEAALNLLKKEDNPEEYLQARTVVTEGFERTRAQIEEIQTALKSIEDQIDTYLLDISRNFDENIQELADNEKILQLKLRLTQAKTREEIRLWGTHIWKGIKSVLPRISGWLKAGNQLLRQGYNRFRKVTGLSPSVQGIEEQLSDYLTETETKIAKLPYVYQRLFRPDPLTDSRFYSGRNTEMEQLKQDFQRWKKGRKVNFGIVGEKGSGKTTLLNFAEQQIFTGISVVKISVTNTVRSSNDFLELFRTQFSGIEGDTPENFLTNFLQDDRERIIIVENLHNGFLRTVDGFDALDWFLQLVTKSGKQFFWIVSCGLYGWRYLNKVLQISTYFHRVLTLGAFSEEQMEAIILKRHRVSGYNLWFDVPEEIANSRKYRNLTTEEEQQQYIRYRFFTQLAELSAGNVRVAILLWLRAISEISQDRIILNSRFDLDYTFLHQAQSEELFTFAALVYHENLSAEEHALIFRQASAASELTLNRMLNKGFLQRNGADYLVHPVLYRPVISVLKTRNILH